MGLPWIVRGRDEQGVAGVGEDEGEELVGRGGAGRDHHSFRVEFRPPASNLFHEACHCLKYVVRGGLEVVL